MTKREIKKADINRFIQVTDRLDLKDKQQHMLMKEALTIGKMFENTYGQDIRKFRAWFKRLRKL